MKKIITTIVIIIIISMIAGVVLATTGTVTTNQLNLRESPSTNANVLTSLSQEQSLNIIGEEGNWYKVQYNDYTGYVSKDYVKANADTQTNNTQNNEDESTTNIVNQSGVIISDSQLYVLPLLNSTKLDILNAGTNLTVVTTTGKWAYIQTDTKSGWVILSRISVATTVKENTTANTNQTSQVETANVTQTEQNISETNNATKEANSTNEYPTKMYVNVDAVYVRSKPNKTADILNSVTLNTEIDVIGVSDNWYQVNLNGDKGYILKDYLSNTKK